jgi:acyl-CoA reductase-like NAD-dependent aldehyde dehydrogenase
MVALVHDSPVRRYTHVIGGVDVPGSGDPIERRNPATGALVAQFAGGTEADAEAAIAAARTAFDATGWASTPGLERGRILHRISERIREEVELLARIEVEETGKPIRLARGDIAGAADHFEYAAGLAAQLSGEFFALADDFTAVNVREPVGVVGLIVPWNFPALILAQKLPHALAAGCTVVVKPSELTSGTACEIVRICREAGVPDGVVNLVTGLGPVVGQAITESPYVDFVSFTGSTASGRKVLAASAGNLKRLSLELGGKAASIVFADADLDRAVEGALFAVTFNQGECCVSGARLLVEDTIADEFVVRLTEAAQQLKVGDPLDETTDIGALIHQGHLDSVLRYVAVGQEQGAELLLGGRRLDDDGQGAGLFVGPTLLDRVEPTAQVFQEEIFGPVLSITRFGTVQEAVDLANDTIYGLANSVWTGSPDTAHRVSRGLKSGTVWVNTTIDGAPQLPLGGYKQSGYGREAGKHGLEEFTNVKSIQTRFIG